MTPLPTAFGFLLLSFHPSEAVDWSTCSTGGMAGRAQRLSRHARRALLANGIDQESNQGSNQGSHPGTRRASFIYWIILGFHHNIQGIAREGRFWCQSSLKVLRVPFTCYSMFVCHGWKAHAEAQGSHQGSYQGSRWV